MNLRHTSDVSSLVQQVLRDAAENKERAILAQLNDLIKTGVIKIEEQAPVLVRNSISDEMEIRQMVRLSFDGAERLKELQEENDALRARLAEIRVMVLLPEPATTHGHHTQAEKK